MEHVNTTAWAAEVASRRKTLFRETVVQSLKRWTLAAAWMAKPERIGTFPSLALACLSDLTSRQRGLPDPERTLNRSGLAGIAHDLGVETLVSAYAQGLFPYGHCGPVKWMSPAERCVLYFNEFHIAKRLRRQIRQPRFTVTFDRDFEGVISNCAARRDGRWHLTWITPRIMHAFADLYDAGHAHSFEVWNDKNRLAGGGYGVAIGGVFFTESQFSREPNTSKIGFSVLNWHLNRWGFTVNDGKWQTPTIAGMGFRNIPRAELRGILGASADRTLKPGRWCVEADLPSIAQWQSGAKSPAPEAETEDS